MGRRQGPKDSSDRAVYVISVVADLAGVHPQTLRTYERKGLLEPQRTAGNSRRYSDNDVEILTRIQQLTEDGVNLAGVRMILDLEQKVRSLEAQLARSHRRASSAELALERQRSSRGVLVRLPDVRNIFER